MFTHHSDTLASKLQQLEGTQVDIQDCFYRFTLDSVGEIAFGVRHTSTSPRWLVERVRALPLTVGVAAWLAGVAGERQLAAQAARPVRRVL